MVRVIARGIGQVMLQNNALSGALILAGIFFSSWQMGLLAIGGTVCSTLAAYLMGYSRADIRDGLYGFNGALVGLAVGVFMPLSLATCLLLVAASGLSTWIAWLFSRQHWLPGFTAPFILTVWMVLGICSAWMPQWLLAAASHSSVSQSVDYFQTLSYGIGQVMFQGNIWAGLLFLAGVCVNSRVAAFYTLLGATLPLLLAFCLPIEPRILNEGLLGYNGVLCAIALGGTSLPSFLWALAAVLLSVAGQWLGMAWGITTLTAPFVVSVWFVWIVRKIGSKRGASFLQ